MKKVLKGKRFADVEKEKTKTTEASLCKSFRTASKSGKHV
jgi:hypothetical protein